jgi:hypothetical protein
MMKRLAIPALLLFGPASVVGADIPRDGKLRVPSTEEVAQVCKENPDIDTDKRLMYCVLGEFDGAERVLEMIADDREAASEAYWNCADTPEINSFALLNACMEQELEIDRAVTSVADDGSYQKLVEDGGDIDASGKDQDIDELEKEN